MHDELKKLLVDMLQKDASDLHITANTPLHYRINDDLVPISQRPLTADEAKAMIYSLLSPQQIKMLEEEKELDLALSIEDVARFRANFFFQRGLLGCAIRLVPLKIRTIAECGLPEEIIKKFCMTQKGLVLVTGATGSGKSTTLAAMVDEINKKRKCHIITVEDPIEFVHQNKSSIVEQRELYSDTHSYDNALRFVLRQDPDVILVGELRDLESIRQALVIADTGHLVLSTLHTADSIQTINRIVDVFPSHQQKQIRTQLSFVLLGIVAQQLIPRTDKKGRVLAAEVFVVTPAAKSMIRDEKIHQVYSILQTSQKIGMKTMNQSLCDLYKSGTIAYDHAISYSPDVEELIKLIG